MLGVGGAGGGGGGGEDRAGLEERAQRESKEDEREDSRVQEASSGGQKRELFISLLSRMASFSLMDKKKIKSCPSKVYVWETHVCICVGVYGLLL